MRTRRAARDTLPAAPAAGPDEGRRGVGRMERVTFDHEGP